MKRNKHYLIGIVGGSASGKTTILRKISKNFDERQVGIISQDDYYKKKEFQKIDKNGEINFDLPSGIEKDMLYQDIKNIISGKILKKEEYAFNVDKQVKIKTIYPAPIIIVEGLFIFYYSKISEMLDIKIFVDSEDEVRLQRRLKRDIMHRGYSEEQIIYQWKNHVQPAYERYVEPFKLHSDVIINNSNNLKLGIDIIKTYINKLLMFNL